MAEQKDTPKQTLAEVPGERSTFDKIVLGVIDWVTNSKHKFQNLGQTNFELGCDHAANNRLFDAMLRFRIAVWFSPGHIEAWYNLGCCQMARGKRPQAVQAFRELLARDADHEEARYMLAVLGVKVNVTRMPASLIQRDYDSRAASYDEESLNLYRYKAPDEALSALKSYLPKAIPGEELEPTLNVLDIGCGTGLCGRLLEPYAENITGVDLSMEMLAEAKQHRAHGRRVYGRLLHKDLLTYLAEPFDGQPFDIVMAVNVFPYIMALDAVTQAIMQRLKSGGYFLFTTEAVTPPDGDANLPFLIPELGRFSHPKVYLEGLAKAQGWTMIDIKPVEIYADYPGILCLWQKPKTAEDKPGKQEPVS